MLLNLIYAVPILADNANHLNTNDMTDSFDRSDMIALGSSLFNKAWVAHPASTKARDGLGPIYNGNTCVSCHPKNGRSPVFINKGKTLSDALVIKLAEKPAANTPIKPEKNYGWQIQTKAIATSTPEAHIDYAVKNKPFYYPDGSKKILKKPIIKIKVLKQTPLQTDTIKSARIAPALFNIALFEQIKPTDIIANEDINDTNSDGISGKVNWLIDNKQRKSMGLFGHKADVPTLLAQVTKAAWQDIGLTSQKQPIESNVIGKNTNVIAKKQTTTGFDISEKQLKAITTYLKNTRLPTQKKTQPLMAEIGCLACHKKSYQLKNGETIYPYTDLLLHDMGDDLSDGFNSASANGNEWRTAPLWHLSKQDNFLHDGRASSIEEAILWHGGEAEKSRQNFIHLNKHARQQLLDFLSTL